MTYREYRRIIIRRWAGLCFLLSLLSFLLGFALAQAQSPSWANYDSRWRFELTKLAGAEMTDPFWMHLHAGRPGEDGVTLGIVVTANSPTPVPPGDFPPGNQVRYIVRGIPVSPWLSPPWSFVLDVSNPALDAILDGIHDITIEVQGPDRARIRPLPVYLHLARGRALEPTVPILAHNATGDYDRYENDKSQGPGIVYVNRAARNHVGYPANPAVTPWHTPPKQSDLYQEEMAPHSDLFLSAQMWWQEPEGTISAGLPFIRGIGSKFGGDHTVTLYDWIQFQGPRTPTEFGFAGHRNLPYKDGPRGVGWASPFVTGQVDSTGGLAFVEAGGPLRYMDPTGEVTTVAGWRVIPGRDPVWILKPRTYIRQNMELRGTWVSGQYADPLEWGFHYPTDVAIDPKNENDWYVAGFGDHTIWKVVIADRITWNATVSVFAGSVTHQPGFADGAGVSARFTNPSSLVFDPVCDCLYVADTNNNAIRKITRTGMVSTLAGSPGMGARLAARGLPHGVVDPATGSYGCSLTPEPMQCYDEQANRGVSKIEVSAAEALTGVKPEVYVPITVRVDSKGNIVFLDMGFAIISKLNPTTGETKRLGDIPGRYDRFLLGWAWLDVDRWGNSGPLDSIYWLQGVGSGPLDGEAVGDHHTNELFAWLPAAGGQSTWVSGPDLQHFPDGWGRLQETDIPHYPWLIAVDPRGALYLAGMGEHGITRIRQRTPADPFPTNWAQYGDAKALWLKGEQVGGHSFSFKFGHHGHNYLGLPDAWGLQPGVTDAELITRFEIPPSIQATPQRLAGLLNFLRLSAGRPLGAPVPDTQPPTVPAALTASQVTPTSLALTWQASTDNVGVTSYALTRNGAALPAVTQPTHTDTGLAPATAYTYTVQATDAAGNLSVPASLTVTTLAPLPPPYAPARVGYWLLSGVTLGCTAIGEATAATQVLDQVAACVAP